LLSAGALALAVSCSEKFNAVESGSTAGSGGMSAGGESESGASGDGTPAGAPAGAEGGAPTAAGDAGGSVAASGGSSAGDAAAGGGGDGPAPTSEVPLAGLQIWLRADSGVAHATRVVSAWQDRSGHGRDALQTASNFAPRFMDGALAGKPALVFDGVDDFLKLSALDVDFSGGLSIFFVLEQETTTCATPISRRPPAQRRTTSISEIGRTATTTRSSKRTCTTRATAPCSTRPRSRP